MKFLVASSLVALSALIPASALAGDTCSTQTLAATHGQKQDIVATAIGAGSFQTLVAAVQAAGLVDTLKGKGPFTVFAPSDEAFAKLPKGTLESLLKPENRQQLVDILTYHVVPAEVTSAAAMKVDFAQTVLGQALRVEKLDIADGKTVLRIDGATVTAADIACSNGVIHVIDTVLLPRKNLVETAKAAGTFKTLLAAAQAAGLVDALSGKEPLTVFAPSDEAFAKLPAGTVESLLKPENKEKLAAVLKYHVVAGRHLAKDVVTLKEVATLNGKHAAIRVDGSGAHIADAKIVATDVLAANGVIHVIDTVMLP
ncbi:MAG: fasciclin domain-containing protein [Planctomycetaceae bacterium]|nr:fasciclin domain-containing protein [Planctomycetaceae bacterium]